MKVNDYALIRRFAFSFSDDDDDDKTTSCRREAATMCPRFAGERDPGPFDLESGVRVTRDAGYLCAKFSLPRPLCSRLMPDVRDSQTDV